jgi:hypothetical protein
MKLRRIIYEKNDLGPINQSPKCTYGAYTKARNNEKDK